MHVCCRAELRAQKWRKVLTTSIIREIFKSTGGVSAGACDGERLDTVNPLDNRSTHHGTSALSLGLVPGGIRVIGGHCLCKLCCVWTKVLFVNGPRFVHNKSYHTRGA